MGANIPVGSRVSGASSRSRSVLGMAGSIRGGMRILIAIGLLAGFGSNAFCASTNVLPGGLTVRRSMRAAPHRLIVHPSAATVAADQTQQFIVTDAQGNPVVVHWNVSGIGCSGQACGTINEQGLYQPPTSLPEPRIVTVEGVLATDPNYSVLTEIHLADRVAAAASPAVSSPAVSSPVVSSAVVSSAKASSSTKVQASTRKPETSAPAAPMVASQRPAHKADIAPKAIASAPEIAPEIERQRVPNTSKLPVLQGAVASAPIVENRLVARGGDLPPMPNVIAAPPAVERQMVSRSGEVLPLPGAVASAPVVESRTLARNKDVPALPRAVPAAQSVERAKVSSRGKMPELSIVIEASPTVEKTTVSARTGMPQLPAAVGAAPQVQKNEVGRRAELLPVPKAVEAAALPSTTVSSAGSGAQPEIRNTVRSQDRGGVRNIELSTMPRAEATSPNAAVSKIDRSTKSDQEPVLLASARTPVPASSPSAGQLPLVVESKKPEKAAILLPMPDAASSSVRSASKQNVPVVYADGQLTINAENMTLAEVLKLVSEKTGAIIEIPPGTGLDRIFEHTGPGRAEDVIASLLNGSPFDFVIVGSPQGTHVPTQVLLSLHKADGSPEPPPQVAKQAPTPGIWTPPEPAPVGPVAYNDLDNFQLPKEPLTPDAIKELMKARMQQVREHFPPQ